MRWPRGRPGQRSLRLPLCGVVRYELFRSELLALEGLGSPLALTPDVCLGAGASRGWSQRAIEARKRGADSPENRHSKRLRTRLGQCSGTTPDSTAGRTSYIRRDGPLASSSPYRS
jgi:hypothetical protein